MSARLVVFISGSGTNLQAILDACESGRLDAEVVLVVSNRKEAYGLVRAEAAGVPTLYFPLKPYREDGRGRAQYDTELAARVTRAAPELDLIVLAGWMHILSASFLDRFPDKVINLHPALPGTFAGTRAIERAYAAFQAGEIRQSGCMVHYVIPEVDAGPVIAQSIVLFRLEDTLADFEARMHSAEHHLIVEAIERSLPS